MKKISTILMALLAGSQIFAQTVSYSVVDKNPDNYKKTALSIDVFDADICTGITMGMAAKLETQVASFIPWLQYKYNYVDGNASKNVDIMPVGGLNKTKHLEVGATWFFRDNNSELPVDVVLHSTSTSSTSRGITTTTTYSKYIQVPSLIKKMTGVDFGYTRSSRCLELDHSLGEDDWQNPDWKYSTPDGSVTLPVFDPGSAPDNVVYPDGSYWMPGTNYTVNTLFFGLRSRKVVNTIINAEGWGKRANRSITDLYFHLMYAPEAKLETMTDLKGREWTLVPANSKMNRNLGWKVGLNYKRFNFFQATAELGYKPGPKIKAKGMFDNGFYLGLGFGFFLGTKHSFMSTYSGEAMQ